MQYQKDFQNGKHSQEAKNKVNEIYDKAITRFKTDSVNSTDKETSATIIKMLEYAKSINNNIVNVKINVSAGNSSYIEELRKKLNGKKLISYVKVMETKDLHKMLVEKFKKIFPDESLIIPDT